MTHLFLAISNFSKYVELSYNLQCQMLIILGG